MKTFDVQTRWATYPNCYLTVNQYGNNGHIAVSIWSDEEGPIADITVNVAGIESMPKNVSAVDINNFPEGIDLVRQLKLGKIQEGKFLRSGFCVYPLVEFNMTNIRKYAEK